MFDYDIVDYWKPRVDQEEFGAMLNLEGSPTIPDQLAQLYNCAVYLDWGKRSVKIGVDDQDTLTLIIRKLRRIEESFKRGFESITAHLVHAEGKSKFMLKFVALDKQQVKAQTTIFDNNTRWKSYPIANLYTVRLMDYDYATEKYKPCKVEPKLVRTAYRTEEHRDWNGYIFHGHTATPSTPTPAANTSDNRYVAPEDHICTYFAPPAGAPAEATISLDPEDSTAPPRMERAKRHPRPTGRRLDGQDLASPSPSPGPHANPGTSGDEPSSPPRYFNFGPSDPSDRSGESSVATTRPRQQNPAQTTAAPPTNLGSGLDLGARPSDRDEPSSQLGASRRPRERRPAHVPGQSTSESSTPTAGVDNEPISSIFLAARPSDRPEGPASTVASRRPRERKPAGDQPSEDKSTGPSSGADFSLGHRPTEAPRPDQAAIVHPNRRPRERKALAGDADAPDESVESVSEAHTRIVWRGGASQKMPSPASNRRSAPEDIRGHNTERISTIFFDALENARGWCGELKLEAYLGRLVFLDIPRKIAKSEIEWPQWDTLMSSLGPSLKTKFTRILTTQHFDIEFIRDLKNSGAEAMFSEEPISSRVTYEFELDSKKKKMLLSVDGETFEPTLYGERRRFSTVNMANPLRLWDYSISLTGEKPFKLSSHPFIKEIYDSLSCSGGTELPVLGFTVDGPSLSVDRVLLKRETRHNVYLESLRQNVPLELVMTEVQELLIKRNPAVRTQYRAVAQPKPDMRRQGRIHWTCSIVPIDTNSLLQQNAKLEVGEIANWTPEGALGLEGKPGGVLPSIVKVLNQIIPKIDNVGFSNKVV